MCIRDRYNVEIIGSSAFEKCHKLCEFSFPEKVTEIRPETFKFCTGLQKFSFPDESNLKRIDDSAFFECSKLNRLVLPEEVEYIGKKVFSARKCSSIFIYRLK